MDGLKWIIIVLQLGLVSANFRDILSNETLNKYEGLTRNIKSMTFYDDVKNLAADIIGKTRSTHCYAMITDSIYRDEIYQEKIFNSIIGKSVFMLTLKDSENFEMEPDEEVKKVLTEIKNRDCDVYLILISNAIQMKGLLRYGDRHRLINTRAKFIMLHDYRLFHSDFHYIWKRIVNVVFIRKYDRYDQTSIKPGKWFEISTVPFPLPIKEVFVAKVLDYWTLGRYRFGKELFIDKTQGLNGEILKIVVLSHTPAVFKTRISDEIVYSGIEVELIKVLSEVMNFSVEYYETPEADEEKWGTKSDNGTFTGLLAEMEEGRADIAIADLHYTIFHLEIMDLSIPYNTECLTFLTPESLSDNSWQTLILPFSPGMWLGVFVSLFFVGIVFYLFSNSYFFFKRSEKSVVKSVVKKWNLKEFLQQCTCCPKDKTILKVKPKPSAMSKDLFDDFYTCILYTYSMLLVVSLPRLPFRWSVRVLTGWWWIYCVLVVVSYRASLTAILANPQPRLTIDKLDMLAKSQIKCGAWGEQNRLFFVTSPDPIAQKIGKKLEHVNDPEGVVNRVTQGDFAYFENTYFLLELRHQHEISERKTQQSLHIMEECVLNMPISLGLEKNSPLKQIVDKYIRRAIESGLTTKWLSEAVREFQSSIEAPPQEALMDLKKFYGALVALGVGYLFGMLALIAELLYWRFVVEKNPLYDKYNYGTIYQQ